MPALNSPTSRLGGAMECRVIGIDCAVSASNVGLAMGRYEGKTIHVEEIVRGAPRADIAGIVLDWLPRGLDEPALLALDAPLGWPVHLGNELVKHRAGDPIGVPADLLFRRATDRFVHERIGKRPLDVGADRIARTALAALGLLQELRQRSGSPIPLAWQPLIAGFAAIEVYPAATMRAHGIATGAYKHARGVADRKEIMLAFAEPERISFQAGLADVSRTSDEVDATACLLAAQDFLRGDALPPLDPRLAAKEGWIWVRPRSNTDGRNEPSLA